MVSKSERLKKAKLQVINMARRRKDFIPPEVHYLTSDERVIFDELFNSFVQRYKLVDAVDKILLARAIVNYIKILRRERREFIEGFEKDVVKVEKMFLRYLRELNLTRRSRNLTASALSLAQLLSKVGEDEEEE